MMLQTYTRMRNALEARSIHFLFVRWENAFDVAWVRKWVEWENENEDGVGKSVTELKLNETVFQMFTSQEVAVGLTSKVFKEIRKLEKQKIYIQQEKEERDRETALHCIESQH